MKTDYSKQLAEFTEKLKKISEILAVYYTGSTAGKTWDEYSDIDIDVVVRDKDYYKIVKLLPKILETWSNEKVNLCNHYEGCDEVYSFIGKNYTKVEIDPIKLSELKPCWKLKNIRIAFDKEGALTKVYKKSQKEKREKLNPAEIIWFFLDTRSNFIYVARHYARGQKLSGVSELGSIGGRLFHYLGKLKGMEGYETLRTAEKHLTKKEWNFLKISACKSLEKKEVKRAIHACWDFMKYLENEYEKKTKSKLNLKCNDKDILKIINKTLDEAKS